MTAWEAYQKRKEKQNAGAKRQTDAAGAYAARQQRLQQRAETLNSESARQVASNIKTGKNDLGQWTSNYTASANLARLRSLSQNAARESTRLKSMAGDSLDMSGADAAARDFQELEKYLKNQNNYFSQWNSQEEYDAAMKAYQQEQEREAMSLDQVQAKYDELSRQLDEAEKAKEKSDKTKASINKKAVGYQDSRIVGRYNPDYQERVKQNISQEAEAGGYDAETDERLQGLKDEWETYKSLLERKQEEQQRAMSAEELEQTYQQAQAALKELEAKRESGETISDRTYDNAKNAEQRLRYLRLARREDFDDVAGQTLEDENDWVYQHVNPDTMQGLDQAKDYILPINMRDWNEQWYQSITDDERKTYNYLYHSEGKEKALEYLDYLKPELNRRTTESMAQESQKAVDKGGWSAIWENIKSVLQSPEEAFGFVDDVARKAAGKDLDVNSYYNRVSNTSSAIEDSTAQNIKNYWEERNNGAMATVMPFLYSTGKSIAENTVRAGMSAGTAGVGAVFAGLGAASDAVIDAKNRGLDDTNAVATGLFAGIAETAFEKFSLDKLIHLERPETIRTALKNVLKQSGVEASEEINTEIANVLTDQLINGDKSNFMMSVKAYMSQGMSEEDARRKAYGDIARNVVEAGLAGAISGGVMAAGKGGIDTLGYQLAYRDENKEIQDTKATPAQLLSYAQNLPQGEAHELANSLSKSKGVSDQEIGRLSLKIKEEVSRNLQAAQSAQQLDAIYRQISRNMPENLRTFVQEEYEIASRSIAAVEAVQEEIQGILQNQAPGAYQRAQARDARTGQELQVTGIDSVSEHGTLLLNTSQGKKSLEDIDILDASQAVLYRQAEGYDKTTATALVRHYRGNVGAQTYARYFDSLYQMGESGLPWESVERSGDAVVQTLGESAAKAAWTLGNRAARMQATAPVVSGRIARIGTGTVTDNTGRAADDVMQLIDEGIAAKTGYDVVVEDTLQNNANGMIQTALQQFTFAADADNEIGARIHELSEYGFANNPNWVRDVSIPLAEYAAKKLGFQGYAQMIKSYQEQYAKAEGSKTSQQALQEAINDAVGGLFSSEDGARDFVEWLTKDSGKTTKEQRTILQRLADFFDRLVKSISDYMKKTPLYDAARLTAQMKLDEAKAMRKVFLEALDVAIENTKAHTDRARSAQTRAQKNAASKDGETRYSINPSFARDIQTWDNEGQKENANFILGSTGEVLQGLGAIESDIYMKGEKIKKILEVHPEMTLDEIKRIPEILEDPVLILKSRNIGHGNRPNTRLIVFGSVKAQNGKPVLAVLDLRPIENNLIINDMQKITSSYTKSTNPVHFISKSEIVYADKKRTIPLLRTIGFQSPIVLQRNGSIGSISYRRNNVNISGEEFNSVISSEINTGASKTNEQNEEFLERYSLRMVSIPESEYRGLVQKNARLENQVKNLMQEFLPSVKGRLRPNENRVIVAADRLLRESGSGMSKKQMTERMTALWSLIHNTDDLHFEDAMTLATDIAAEMMEEGSQKLDPTAQEILNDIRSYRVYLDDVAQGAIISAFDTLSNYKGLLRGAVRFTNHPSDGIEIDTLMGLLAENYPGYFEEVNAADAPTALLEKISGLRSMFEARDGHSRYLTIEEEIYQLAIRLLQETAVITAHETYADKQQSKAEKLRQEMRAQMQQWRQQKLHEYNQRLAQEKKGISETLRQLRKRRNAETDPKAREALQKKIDRLNQREGDQVAQVRAMYDRKISERIESEAKQKARDAIRRDAQRLIRLLDRPTNQNHVASELLPDIKALVNLLIQQDGVINREFQDKAARLLVRYQRRANKLEAFFDEDTVQRLGNLSEIMKGQKFNNLNSADLREIRSIVEHFSHLVTEQNKLLSMERAENLTRIGERAYGEINRLDDRLYRSFMMWEPVKKIREAASDLFNRLSVKPEQFFSELGGTMYELYRNMQKGEGVWARTVQEARDFYQKLKQEYPVDEWLKSKERIEFTTEYSKEVSLSLGEAMSLYMTLLRKQGREHVLEGGFVLENAVKEVTVKKDGKKETSYKTDDNGKIPLSPQDMIAFSSMLTKDQKDFAFKLGRYLSEDMAKKGNAVSRKLYGYDKFTEERYWPIYTAENYLPFSGKKHGDPQIKSKGFTKITTPHSGNSVIIRDVVDTWANHVNEMAQYHALALPVEDFNRVYNYTSESVKGHGQDSIKELIEKKLGTRGKKYIEQFMIDLNGGVRQASVDRFASKMVSRFKKVSVMANLSVMIQQPSAFIRAMAEVNPKYFAHIQGNAAAYTKKGWEELKRYAPVAIIKEMGGFDTNMGVGVTEWIKGDQSKLNRAYDFVTSRGAEKMDEITWCHIWNAVKRETADLHPEFEQGSEAFLNKAGERFNEVIARTQVYDSVFSRSEAMRSRSALAQMATSFMAEPTVSYNMLRHAVVLWGRNEKGAAKYFTRTFGAYLGSVILNSLLKALPYAMRDDDEDKNFLEKYATAAINGILWDWTSLLPFIRDAVSIFQGYDVERADTALVSDLAYAINKLSSDKASDWDKARMLAEAIANMCGIPLKNFNRDIESIFRTGAELVASGVGDGKR